MIPMRDQGFLQTYLKDIATNFINEKSNSNSNNSIKDNYNKQ